MKQKKFIFFFFLFFIIAIFFILNKNTTRSIGINYKVVEYQVPIYLKILDFYDRHYNYKFLVKTINKNVNDKKDIILNLTKWINSNIKKIPPKVDVIDSHPLTIVERRLGTEDQFSDLLSVLLVYSEIDSFFLMTFPNNDWHPLTFFKIDNYWSIIDPYFGVYFTNDERFFASIRDLKNNKWQMLNLESEKINESNFKNFFGEKYKTYDELIYWYNRLFQYVPSNNDIENTNVFYLGGRAYTQSPIRRLMFEIYSLIN